MGKVKHFLKSIENWKSATCTGLDVYMRCNETSVKKRQFEITLKFNCVCNFSSRSCLLCKNSLVRIHLQKVEQTSGLTSAREFVNLQLQDTSRGFCHNIKLAVRKARIRTSLRCLLQVVRSLSLKKRKKSDVKSVAVTEVLELGTKS